MLIVLERECLERRAEVEHFCEKQKVSAGLMEGKMSVQKVALEDFQRQIFQELEDKRSTGTCTTQAQVGKMRR